MEIEYIIKRDFSTKPFSLDKITGAIHKAMNAVGNGTQENAQDVAPISLSKVDGTKKQRSNLCSDN